MLKDFVEARKTDWADFANITPTICACAGQRRRITTWCSWAIPSSKHGRSAIRRCSRAADRPTTIEAIESNIAAMVSLAKGASVRVVLAAVPPSAGFNWATAVKPVSVIAELDRRLRALAAREGATFVDYGSVLRTPRAG